MTKLTQSTAWLVLQATANRLAKSSLQDLMTDTQRQAQMVLTYQGLTLDYAYQHIDQDAIKALMDLAAQQGLSQKIHDLFNGKVLDATSGVKVGGHYVLRQNQFQKTDEFQQLVAFVQSIRQRQEAQQPIKHYIHIGIGGSQLGAKLACEALAPYADNPLSIHFVDTFDSYQLQTCLQDLDPAASLICMASKSLKTAETRANAEVLRQWQPDMQHWVAVTSNVAEAKQWGIPTVLTLPNDVGGRFSIWSSMALPVILKIGIDNFRDFLRGAHALDKHTQNAVFAENIPVILALLDIWNINFRQISSQAVIPYDSRLLSLKDYLQQLAMESLGKSVTVNGEQVDYQTGCVVWGGLGGNVQHSCMQLLLQGTFKVATDFILTLDHVHSSQAKQIANDYALSYREALALGNDATRPSKRVLGGQPSNLITIPKLDPFYLGMLLALYEHKVYIQSAIWQINCFDQYGIELGKTMHAVEA